MGAKGNRQHEAAVPKTDGSLGDARIEKLKRPVSSDAFLIDRELSPEEEGRAGSPEEDDVESRSK